MSCYFFMIIIKTIKRNACFQLRCFLLHTKEESKVKNEVQEVQAHVMHDI